MTPGAQEAGAQQCDRDGCHSPVPAAEPAGQAVPLCLPGWRPEPSGTLSHRVPCQAQQYLGMRVSVRLDMLAARSTLELTSTLSHTSALEEAQGPMPPARHGASSCCQLALSSHQVHSG